jgi:hypothetical protein
VSRSGPTPTGSATSFGLDSYATIQDAVNHVNTGATVNIAAGTDSERVVIAPERYYQNGGRRISGPFDPVFT